MFLGMCRAWRAGCVFFLVAFCCCKVPVKIKSVYNNRYLDASGNFEQKKHAEGQIYAKTEKDTGDEKRFRVLNGSGKGLAVKKDQSVAWVPKSDAEVLTVAEEKDGEAYLKTKDGRCLKRSAKDKVETGKCPKERKDKDSENYLFRVTFGAGKGNPKKKQKQKKASEKPQKVSAESSGESACAKCRIPAPCAEACSNPPAMDAPADCGVPMDCGVPTDCGGGCNDCSAGEEAVKVPVKVEAPGPCGKTVAQEPCACLRELGRSRLVGGSERRQVSFFAKQSPKSLFEDSTDAIASLLGAGEAKKSLRNNLESTDFSLDTISKGLDTINSKIPGLKKKDENKADTKSLAQRVQDFAAGKAEGKSSALMNSIRALTHTLKTTVGKLDALVSGKSTKQDTEKSTTSDSGAGDIVSALEPPTAKLAEGLLGKL